ncbi:MAG: hypothetical protein PHI37_02910 [Candidatus Gracilibacteria bacterium]|nr:hypothetical protein [Candidatus Gracilibacteria bacterium]
MGFSGIMPNIGGDTPRRVETIADGRGKLNEHRNRFMSNNVSGDEARGSSGLTDAIADIKELLEPLLDLEEVINDAGKGNEGGNTFVSQGHVWPMNQGGDGRVNPFSSNN